MLVITGYCKRNSKVDASSGWVKAAWMKRWAAMGD